jgi:3-deoxy-manno-octulosonate cytidylyltransferase (CMP-KDO synthetase)
MTAFHVIIPARYASTRLPGKLLLDIAGKPMLQHVYDRCLESGAQTVTIATEDANIAAVAEGFGAPVCMTPTDIQTGTDRIAAVLRLRNYAADAIIVNVQGDEPLIPPALIKQVAMDLATHAAAEMATLYTPIETIAELFNPNHVKVVLDTAGYALYFSRAPIPWDRAQFNDVDTATLHTQSYYRHVGLYAYRVQFIQKFVSLPPTPIEQLEALEQLRALWHGARIFVGKASQTPPIDVNTIEDLIMVRQLC